MQVEQDIPASVLVRVYLLGPLEIRKKDSSGTWKLVSKEKWKNSKPARSVFKRLLVQPGRRLSRSSIEDEVWSEAENFELTTKNVYNAISLIRGIIGKPLVTCWDAIYEIADQTLVWTDLDTCSALLKEAENRGQGSIHAVPFLEQAVTLLERGELLEGEDGKWCYAFCKRAEDMLRQVCLWLAESYETQGKLWQAGEQYRGMILTDPSDEAFQRRLNSDFLRIAQTTSVSNDERSKQLLLNVAVLPFTHLESLQKYPSQSSMENVLRKCAASLVACQHLLRRGNFFQVEYVLTHVLLILTELSSHHASSYQKRAASLASQGYRLANILALHHDNLQLKEHYCQQALQQSLIAEEDGLSVAALKGLAVTFYYRNAPMDAIEVYQRALQYNNSSTLLRSCASIGLAQAYAQCGKKHLALHTIEQAYSLFPEHPEADVSFLYADFDRTQLMLWEGLTYLALGHYHFTQNERHQSQSYCQKAWETLATVEQTSKLPPSTARDRTDILHHMTSTALILDDPQRFCSYMEQGTKETVVLGSKKRKKELITTYLRGRNAWPQNRDLKDIGDGLLTAFFAEGHPLS